MTIFDTLDHPRNRLLCQIIDHDRSPEVPRAIAPCCWQVSIVWCTRIAVQVVSSFLVDPEVKVSSQYYMESRRPAFWTMLSAIKRVTRLTFSGCLTAHRLAHNAHDHSAAATLHHRLHCSGSYGRPRSLTWNSSTAKLGVACSFLNSCPLTLSVQTATDWCLQRSVAEYCWLRCLPLEAATARACFCEKSRHFEHLQ